MTPEEFIEEGKRRGIPKDELRARFTELKAGGAFDEAPATAAPVAEAPQPDISAGQSALEGAKQGLTFGWADEAQAWLGNKLDDWMGLNDAVEAMGYEPAEDGYETLRDAYRDDLAAAREANPAAFMGGEFAGSMLLPGGVSRSAGKQLLRAGAEGAAYGAGEAEDLSKVPGAMVFGAGAGAGATGLLSGAGRIGRAMSKQRTDDLVDEAGNFVPAHLADRVGRIGDFYRNFVGRSFGGKRALAEQEEPFVKAAKETFDEAQKNLDEVTDDIWRANKKTPQEVIDIEMDVAKEQAKRAVPDNAPDKVWNKVDRLKDPRKIAKALREYWNKDAFKQVKDMTFEVDEDFVNILRREFPEDDIADTMRAKTSGEDLINLRNRYAIGANKSSGMDSGKQRQFANTIDNWMRSKMGKQEAQFFNDELASYGEYAALERALAQSKKGRFNVDSLARGGRKRDRAVGEAYGQARAEAAQERIAKAKMKIAEAQRSTKKAATKAVKEAREEGSELAKALTPENASGLSEYLTTRAMSPVQGNGLIAGALGTLTGRALATEGAQRAVTGNAGWQRSMRKIGEDERARLLAEAIRRYTTMQSAQNAAGG